jgi:hypothetical protein
VTCEGYQGKPSVYTFCFNVQPSLEQVDCNYLIKRHSHFTRQSLKTIQSIFKALFVPPFCNWERAV